MAGVRSSKTVGSTTYNYTTLSGLVTRQTWGSNSIDFLYDENNQPFAMKYNGTWYYYVLNVQGDVVKLIKADGTVAASYTYDPWGKVLTSTGDLANINPLRYRGYYYDTETGLYYLQSRYYDPEIGRFINADTYTTTDSTGILSANMYAYCENDPVMGVDPKGEIIDTIFDVVSLGLSVAEVVANPANPWSWIGLAGDVIDLIPGVTGVGETIRAVKTTTKVTKKLSKATKKAEKVKKIHGNSLNSEKLTIGYAIVKKDTGKIMKYGETTRGVNRYSKKFYRENNVSMVVMAKGNKRDMHYWQHDRILEYYRENGCRPSWNKSFW